MYGPSPGSQTSRVAGAVFADAVGRRFGPRFGQPPMWTMGRLNWASAARSLRSPPWPPCLKCLPRSAASIAPAMSASDLPSSRTRSRSESESRPKRQVLSWPSAVTRTRLHVPQKCSVMELMKPTRPGFAPSGPTQLSPPYHCVVELASAAKGRMSGRSLLMLANNSAWGTRTLASQSLEAKGIHSMKRTSTPRATKYFANAAASTSLDPRMTTQFTLTWSRTPGLRESAAAASTAARTLPCVAGGLREMRANFSASNESKEMFSESTRAATRASRSVRPSGRLPRSVTPFVVSPIPSTAPPSLVAVIDSQISTRSRRIVGSPPVKRTLRAPPQPAKTPTTRAISPASRSSAFGVSAGTPSAGMQYWQRRLHFSVSEIRK
mmetsp:Transcript_23565/g.80486  ORF Transcript_23565/g.80486 Transcript_23565/m.80486 type:complete len:380 (+) Transcript_23565:111-1250(+)